MAAKPVERFVKKQIADQGGWPRILERIASGETLTAIASTLRRPDGDAISYGFFRRLLYQDPRRVPELHEAKRVRAEAWADQALAKSDAPMSSQVEVGQARVQIDARLRLAGLADPEPYGESKTGIPDTVNSATLHVDALRHRMVDASRPLVELLSKPESSAADSERGVVLARVEQSDTGGDSFSTSAAAP